MAELFFAEQRIDGFTFEDGLGYHTIQGAIIPPFTVGEMYSVVWEGDTFLVTAFAVEWPGLGNFVAVGDGSLLSDLGDFPGNGEPFLILTSPNTTAISAFADPAEYHMVAIYLGALEDKDYLIKSSTLKAIGNAIREKTGKTDVISPNDMPGEIRGITGGGSGADVVYVTFMNHDGTKELHKRAVVPGNTCLEPVGAGLMDTPTRESTAQYDYTFAGWATEANGGLDADALKNVTKDRVVYANYIATVRHYTVRFYDGDTLLDTQSVAYGGSATPPTIEKDGYQLDGWEPDYTNITADTDCYAKWAEQITFANATWEQIAEISKAGEAANYFALGDAKTVVADGVAYTVKIIGFGHDDLADGSGKAGMTMMFFTMLADKSVWIGSGYNNMRYTASTLATGINTFRSSLPDDLKSVMKSVTKKFNGSGSSSVDSTYSGSFTMWAPTSLEIGYTGGRSAISNYGETYDYFASTRYGHQGTSTHKACLPDGTAPTSGFVWTRMAGYSSERAYCVPLNNSSTTDYYNSIESNVTTNGYVASCFCI